MKLIKTYLSLIEDKNDRGIINCSKTMKSMRIRDLVNQLCHRINIADIEKQNRPNINRKRIEIR